MRPSNRWLLAVILLAPAQGPAAKGASASDIPSEAIARSQITLPGSRPFHLKATVVESTNPDNDSYKAEIEEEWLAPEKWRRVVKSSEFSQILVVSGDRVKEQSNGAYYPNWLRTIVAAIFEPGSPLRGLDMSKSGDNPMIGGTKFCRRFAFRAGVPPVGNNVFSTFCFQGGLLDSVGMPGYEAEYLGYKKFADKQVARKVREYIEPGTELEAKIELNELGSATDSEFAVQETTPQLRTVVVSEETARGTLVAAPEIHWPPIQGGKSSGVLSVYVCVDRDGVVRETYPLNSDHPDMTDAARKQVMSWRFKPALKEGTAVQFESILTFAYQTTIEPSPRRP